MKPVTRTVYEAHDGTIFDSAAACQLYEKKAEERAKATTYWQIQCRPDCTEGRGWYGLILVECFGPVQHHAEMYVQDYCFHNLGRPIAFVMGVSPIRNWSLTQIDKARYDRDDQSTHVGDYAYPATRIRLTLERAREGYQLVDENAKK